MVRWRSSTSSERTFWGPLWNIPQPLTGLMELSMWKSSGTVNSNMQPPCIGTLTLNVILRFVIS